MRRMVIAGVLLASSWSAPAMAQAPAKQCGYCAVMACFMRVLAAKSQGNVEALRDPGPTVAVAPGAQPPRMAAMYSAEATKFLQAALAYEADRDACLGGQRGPNNTCAADGVQITNADLEKFDKTAKELGPAAASCPSKSGLSFNGGAAVPVGGAAAGGASSGAAPGGAGDPNGHAAAALRRLEQLAKDAEIQYQGGPNAKEAVSPLGSFSMDDLDLVEPKDEPPPRPPERRTAPEAAAEPEKPKATDEPPSARK